jgi:hypothetical protein
MYVGGCVSAISITRGLRKSPLPSWEGGGNAGARGSRVNETRVQEENRLTGATGTTGGSFLPSYAPAGLSIFRCQVSGSPAESVPVNVPGLRVHGCRYSRTSRLPLSPSRGLRASKRLQPSDTFRRNRG